MKVHNLTDVSTAALLGAGLLNTAITVGGVTVAPGESAEVGSIAGADRFIRVEALFVGETPPASYTNNKPAKVEAKALTKTEGKLKLK